MDKSYKITCILTINLSVTWGRRDLLWKGKVWAAGRPGSAHSTRQEPGRGRLLSHFYVNLFHGVLNMEVVGMAWSTKEEWTLLVVENKDTFSDVKP